jgi:O-antigen/teichoic acid export membrane protein
LPGGTFDAISNAYERFVFTRGLNIIKYVSRAILIVALLMQFKSALFLVVLDTILNIVVIVITMYFVFKKLKVSFSFRSFNTTLIKEIFSYSIWIFLFAISYRLQWYSGQTILGLTTDTVTVAIFGVGVMLGGYYGAFAGAINTLLLPRATKMSVQNDNAESYTYEMIRVGKVNVFILFLILSGFFVFGKAFIKLWVGETYLEAWWVAVLIMIAGTLSLLQSFGNSVLEAKKKNRFKSMVSLTTKIIAVFIGYFLSKKYGIYGIIYPLVTTTVINILIMNFYYHKIFGFKIAQFFKEVLFKQTLMILILIIIGIYLMNKFVIYTWWDLAFGASFFSIIYLVLNYLFVLDEDTKLLISRFKR